jgi:DNA polymerase-3 subunit gamma/tau
MALYRKFRPQEFAEVKGQDHIVTTLKNQIRAQRIGHAYLFCGTRGTGKTTIAKLFAKAVNCEHPIDQSPCGECPSCNNIAEGNSMNLIEIDAASNNGVDNIREIREEVTYSPTQGKYKVYIIDEVHMLSVGAFNALLKTLEEPPAYVIFILATTEAHKIPITILSRCQRYDFRRITIETIASCLSDLMTKEQVEVEEKALRYIAKVADGSMRDALSLLDQCIAFFMDQTLTYDKVLDVLGAVDTEVFHQMLQNINKQDIIAVIALLEELITQGREPGQFVTDFTWYLRNLLLIKSSDQMDDMLQMSTENVQLLKQQAQNMENEVLIRFIRIFSELSNQIRYGTQKRVLIEIALIKLCQPQMEKNLESILQRLSQMEKQLANGILPAAAPSPPTSEPMISAAAEKLKRPTAIPADIRQVVENWPAIIRDLPAVLRTVMKSGHLSLGTANQLLIVLENDLDIINLETRKKEISEMISEKIGKEIEVELCINETKQSFEDSFYNIESAINMELTIED